MPLLFTGTHPRLQSTAAHDFFVDGKKALPAIVSTTLSHASINPLLAFFSFLLIQPIY